MLEWNSYLLHVQRGLDLRYILVDVSGETVQVYGLSDRACHLGMAVFKKTTLSTEMLKRTGTTDVWTGGVWMCLGFVGQLSPRALTRPFVLPLMDPKDILLYSL